MEAPKIFSLFFINKCNGTKGTRQFLSYKPDTYEFFYVSCQLSETLLFSANAPVIVDGQIGFTYHKNVECTSVEVYNAFTATLLNNINNFGERYGVSFHDTFTRFHEKIFP